MDERFQWIREELRIQRHLSSIQSLLSWDEEVMLPPGGARARSEQIAVVAQLLHDRRTSPRFVERVQELDGDPALDADEQTVVRESRRDVERSLRVPRDLVGAIARATSTCYTTWVEARALNSFAHVKPHLTELIARKREFAEALSPDQPYDALIDLYERGLTAERTAALFSVLRRELTSILVAIEGADAAPSVAQVPLQASKAAQNALCREIVGLLGFDTSKGRVDESVHPFCSEIATGDVRMTTRYHEDEPFSSLFTVLHELGHALYDQGFNAAWDGTPLGEACSLGVHESQSLFWENQIGRSRSFCEFLAPRVRERFGEDFPIRAADGLYRQVNQVARTLVRVEADEVTYGLHVILRFDLERRLIAGELTVDDLVEAWNAAYQSHLGIVPPDDRGGVLQDVHWYSGSFGYFPTYVIGRIYAAELYQALERDMGGLDEQVRRGKFSAIREWLRDRIHQQGKRYLPETLIARSIGHQPSAETMVAMLRTKYGDLYRLNLSASATA